MAVSHQALIDAGGVGGNDSNTLLLMHMDGVSSGTSFPDSSPNARTASTVSGANTSTSTSRFGPSAVVFTGTWYVEMSPAIVLGTGSFTVDFWVYVASATSALMCLTGNLVTGSGSTAWMVTIGGSASNCVGQSTATAQMFNDATHPIPLTTWTHIAYVRSGTTVTVYINGVSIGTYSDSNNYSATNLWRVGANNISSISVPNCYIDELRVSNVARWTANFTPNRNYYS